MRADSVRRALRLGACTTVAAGLVTLGLATAPAYAGTEPETDQLWITAPYEPTLPLGVDGGTPMTRTLDVRLNHDNDHFTVTDGRLTVDASGLAGVAEITWPDNCTPSGATAVCDVPEVPVTGTTGGEVHLKVRAADGAAVGARGRITFEATATGGPDGTLTAPHDSFDTTVTVASGPDLGLTTGGDIEGARPGSTQTLPFTLTNHGNETAHGFTVTMTASYGVRYLNRYDACVYTTSSGDEYAPMSYATCTFHQDLAPGASFELPEPPQVELTSHALRERVDISAQPIGATDLGGADDYVALQIGADNTADFSVTGAAVTGAAGETVTASPTFKNNGPAWLGNLGSGDPVADVRLIVPSGTTVTGVPEGCVPRTLSGGYYPNRTGAPRYDCSLPYWVLENTERSFPFKLRIDTVVPGATGEVSIHPPFGEFRDDPDLTNNSAVLTVN
ncbi:hypothetical protein FRZ03_04440 [Streptomyces misionensis]|uniref:DUF11 domain-containing protein n=1 Tax=Streptomyces misionensis TaxID=67331 RepID=A0A5C6K3Y2_9ACTN|nr:hypothetical protein [Streptomyces misionensis]TWV56348.1 hypothetical protein FRZ03_04440 [Streptomyces misionensis]